VNWIKSFSILGTVAIASTITSLAIAQSASARFVIFVAGNDSATLQRVRTVSPGAFATKINSQPVIQAGTFNSEISADSLAIALQQSGLSAQKYFRASAGKESNVPLTVTPSSMPQQVVVQTTSTPQQVVIQPESQPQTFTSVPQVQTQQVLVPRWQQVLVPETRQVVTQTVVPQTQIVQSGTIQTGTVQTGYIQPQTGFIQSLSTAIVPTSYDNSVAVNYATPNYATTQSQPVSAELSSEQLLPQQSQNPNFRYVAAVPAKASNQFLLSRVRQYVPSAFFSNSGRGTYIHAGSYQNRDSAESVSRYLRSQGVDSRVLYF
jgi:hypothetical protein